MRFQHFMERINLRKQNIAAQYNYNYQIVVLMIFEKETAEIKCTLDYSQLLK